MSSVNPNHPRTRPALAAALDLAAVMWPVNDKQMAAQSAIYRAAKSGDLYATIEATRQARTCFGITWRNAQADWFKRVRETITEPLRRREAA